jgi:hypothetical protein
MGRAQLDPDSQATSPLPCSDRCRYRRGAAWFAALPRRTGGSRWSSAAPASAEFLADLRAASYSSGRLATPTGRRMFRTTEADPTRAARPSSIGGRPGPVRVGPSSADEAAVPPQDCDQGDQTMATQCAGQPPHERSEDGPVRQSRRGLGLVRAQDGDFVAQHGELDVLGGGRVLSGGANPSTFTKIK